MEKIEQAHVGLVVASYGQRGILESKSGERIKYQLKGRKLRAVCGDLAEWSLPDDAGVELVAERETAKICAALCIEQFDGIRSLDSDDVQRFIEFDAEIPVARIVL